MWVCAYAHVYKDVHMVYAFMSCNDYSQQIILFLQPLFLAISGILPLLSTQREISFSVTTVGISCSAYLNVLSCDTLKSGYLCALFLVGL